MGEAGPLNMPMSTLIALVLTVLCLALVIVIIFLNIKPYEQIARANTERLAAAINEACFLNVDDHHMLIANNFNLPQSTPFLSSVASIGPAVRILTDTDPKFNLYYEMFPPGEAVSWEGYHSNIGFRAAVMLPDGLEGRDTDYIASFLDSAREEVRKSIIENVGKQFGDYDTSKPAPDRIDVFIGNLMVDSVIDPLTGEAADTALADGSGGTFKINTEMFSSPLNRTIPKYLSCGDHSLCLKTPTAIYSYPLDNCKKAGIDYIQFSQIQGSARGRRISNFYLSSPCTFKKLEIYIADNCNTNTIFMPPDASDDIRKCDDRSINYAIYDYRDGKLESVGNHSLCFAGLRISNDKNNLDELHEGLANGKCIRVINRDEADSGFCFTKNAVSNCQLPAGLTPGCAWPVENHLVYKQYPIDGKETHVIILIQPTYKLFESWGTIVFPWDSPWRWPN